jgi:hypothetical protein
MSLGNPYADITVTCIFDDTEEPTPSHDLVTLDDKSMKTLPPLLRNHILMVGYVYPALNYLAGQGIKINRLCSSFVFDFRRDPNYSRYRGLYHFGHDIITLHNFTFHLGNTVRRALVHELVHSIGNRQKQCVRRYFNHKGIIETCAGLRDRFYIIKDNSVVNVATYGFFEEAIPSFLQSLYRGDMSLAPLIIQCIQQQQYALVEQNTRVCMDPFFNYFLFAQKAMNSLMKQDPQTAQQIKQRIVQIEKYLSKSYGVSFQTVYNYLSQASQEYPQDSLVSVADIKKLNLNLYKNLPRDKNDTYRYKHDHLIKLDENISELDKQLHLPVGHLEVFYPGVLVASPYTFSARILETLFQHFGHTGFTIERMLELRTSREQGYPRNKIREMIGKELFNMLYPLDPMTSDKDCKEALYKTQQYLGIRY